MVHPNSEEFTLKVDIFGRSFVTVRIAVTDNPPGEFKYSRWRQRLSPSQESKIQIMCLALNDEAVKTKRTFRMSAKRGFNGRLYIKSRNRILMWPHIEGWTKYEKIPESMRAMTFKCLSNIST